MAINIQNAATVVLSAKVNDLDKGLRQATKKINELEKALEKANAAGAKVGKGQENMGKNIAGMIGKLKGGIGAFGAYGAAIATTLVLAKKFSDHGNKIRDVMSQVKVPLEAATKATGHLVSALDLGRISLDMARAGAKLTGKQFEEMAAIGTTLGLAYGGDAKSGVEEFAKALASGDQKALSQMGIIVDVDAALDAYAKRLGVTKEQLTKAQIEQVRLNAALEAGKKAAEQTGVDPNATRRGLDRATGWLGDKVDGAFDWYFDGLDEADRREKERIKKFREHQKQLHREVKGGQAGIVDAVLGASNQLDIWYQKAMIKAKEHNNSVAAEIIRTLDIVNSVVAGMDANKIMLTQAIQITESEIAVAKASGKSTKDLMRIRNDAKMQLAALGSGGAFDAYLEKNRQVAESSKHGAKAMKEQAHSADELRAAWSKLVDVMKDAPARADFAFGLSQVDPNRDVMRDVRENMKRERDPKADLQLEIGFKKELRDLSIEQARAGAEYYENEAQASAAALARLEEESLMRQRHLEVKVTQTNDELEILRLKDQIEEEKHQRLLAREQESAAASYRSAQERAKNLAKIRDSYADTFGQIGGILGRAIFDQEKSFAESVKLAAKSGAESLAAQALQYTFQGIAASLVPFAGPALGASYFAAAAAAGVGATMLGATYGISSLASGVGGGSGGGNQLASLGPSDASKSQDAKSQTEYVQNYNIILGNLSSEQRRWLSEQLNNDRQAHDGMNAGH